MTYSQLLDIHFQISIEKLNLIQAMKTSSDVSLRDLYLLKVEQSQGIKLQLIEADILETDEIQTEEEIENLKNQITDAAIAKPLL